MQMNTSALYKEVRTVLQTKLWFVKWFMRRGALLPLSCALVACGGGSSTSSDRPLQDAVEFIDVRAQDLGATSATIRFNTSVATTCEVEYGLAADALGQVATDPMMGGDYVVEHEVTLAGLTPGTTHYYRARGTTPAGETYWSAVHEFATLEVPEIGDAGLVNYALSAQGASIRAVSSNFAGAANDETWGAAFAVDGELATEWATDGDGDDAALAVDFSAAREISRFVFRSRKMPDGTSIIASVRLVFETAADEVVMGPFATPDPEQIYTFDFPAAVVATGVRFTTVATTGGNTGAKEIQFWGSPSP